MNNVSKDVLVALFFIGGIWSFISGEFILSTVLFASAAVYSNIAKRSPTV